MIAIKKLWAGANPTVFVDGTESYLIIERSKDRHTCYRFKDEQEIGEANTSLAGLVIALNDIIAQANEIARDANAAKTGILQTMQELA